VMLTKEWFTVVNGAGVYVVYSNDRDDHSSWGRDVTFSPFSCGLSFFISSIVSARWPLDGVGFLAA
jgi:hypothetical protein